MSAKQDKTAYDIVVTEVFKRKKYKTVYAETAAEALEKYQNGYHNAYWEVGHYEKTNELQPKVQLTSSREETDTTTVKAWRIHA